MRLTSYLAALPRITCTHWLRRQGSNLGPPDSYCLPQLPTVSDYIFTHGMIRWGAGRSRVTYRSGSSSPSLYTFQATFIHSPGLARYCPHLHVLGFHRIHPVFNQGYPWKCQI